jgi:hypothetical protein
VNNDECFFDVSVTGLNRNDLADNSLPSDEQSMWRRPGFWKYASEYWLLAQLHLERVCLASQEATPDGEARITEQVDDSEMNQLKGFIHKLQSFGSDHSGRNLVV